MSLAGKAAKTVTTTGNFFTGINPAIFKGIKEFEKKDRTGMSYAIVFNVIGKDGVVSEREESIYVLTKDDSINIKVINSLLVSLGIPEETLLKDGETFTEEMEKWIASMVGTRVGLLMYSQKREGDEYGYHHTNSNGFLKDMACINHADKVTGEVLDIGEVISGKSKGKSSGGGSGSESSTGGNPGDRTLR